MEDVRSAPSFLEKEWAHRERRGGIETSHGGRAVALPVGPIHSQFHQISELPLIFRLDTT